VSQAALAGKPTALEETASETLAETYNLTATKPQGIRSFFIPTSSLARALFRAGVSTAGTVDLAQS
jgi:hypothetical protein